MEMREDMMVLLGIQLSLEKVWNKWP